MEKADMIGIASRAIAGCFALAAFSVAIIAGLASGITASSILMRALLAMVVCYPVGLLVGFVCRYVIEQHLGQAAEPTVATDTVSEPSEQSAENAEKAQDVIVV
jgi:hypothetical protein